MVHLRSDSRHPSAYVYHVQVQPAFTQRRQTTAAPQEGDRLATGGIGTVNTIGGA